jgi:hypothetical protein
MNPTPAFLLAAAAAMLTPGAVLAAPAQANGSAQVVVVTAGSVVPLTVLRFGQFMQPTTAGTMTIDIAGAVSQSGGVVGTNTITQVGAGRGPGTFLLTGTPNRQTDIVLPASTTIANGAQSMTVNAFTANTNGAGKLKLDAAGSAVLIVGATLNVPALPAFGPYSGTYTITVAFQ